MREAHMRAKNVLSERKDQLKLMEQVLLERETVEGEAVEALLDNKWDEYLASHPEEQEKEEEAAEEAVRTED